MSFLNEALNAIYVQNYFKQVDRYNIIILINNIKEIFENILNENYWLDENSKINLINKV